MHFDQLKWLVFSYKSEKDKKVTLKNPISVALTKCAKIFGENGDLVKYRKNVYRIKFRKMQENINIFQSYLMKLHMYRMFLK